MYQYYFVGKRPSLANDPASPATEFIFDATSDRKLTYAISVLLPAAVVSAWNARHGRVLNDAEQYAAIKIRLFRCFDEVEDVATQGRRLLLDDECLEDALGGLGIN